MNDKTKFSQIDILLSKDVFDLLISFKFFLKRFEHDQNKCTRIRIDNEIEYINEIFIDYCRKKEIRIESTIVENFQINDCVERLNQIFMNEIDLMTFRNNVIFMRFDFVRCFVTE